MIVGVIETSTERAIAAIFDNGNPLGIIEMPFGLTSSKYLLPEFEKLLDAHDLVVKDLGCIVSGVGPGSYTGIRVGAVIAKTLSFTCQIPLVGVCSLEGFVHQGQFAAVMDAKMSGVYLQQGKKEGDVVTWESDPLVLPVEEAREVLKDVEHLVTSNQVPLQKKLGEQKGVWHERAPDVEVLLRAGMRKFQEGDYTCDGRLELLYLRKTQAEIDRDSP